MGFAEFVYPKDLLYEVASVANDTLTGTNENNNGTDWLQGFFDFYYNNPVPLGLGFFSILYGLSLIAVVFLVCFSTTREFSVNPPCPLLALCKRLEKSMKNGKMQWKLVDPKDSCLFWILSSSRSSLESSSSSSSRSSSRAQRSRSTPSKSPTWMVASPFRVWSILIGFCGRNSRFATKDMLIMPREISIFIHLWSKVTELISIQITGLEVMLYGNHTRYQALVFYDWIGGHS